MKRKILVSLLAIISNTIMAQNSNDMKQQFILTNLGSIAVYQKTVPNSIPVVFLHGVYYDHNLWNYHVSRITDRTIITVDMPLHGKSKDISKRNWTMEDCANMLLEVLDSLGHNQVYAIGHSWGSMTILRAAAKSTETFKGIGLCNMPIDKGTFGIKLKFGFQHFMLPFRRFYTKQVAKAMFSKENRMTKPEIVEYLEISMSLLSNKDVMQTDRAVIIKADDGKKYLNKLQAPALCLKGNQDYVGTAKNTKMVIVDGAHTSPLEQPKKVMNFIEEILKK
ncbi:MAG: alpha/beta hydrolase [Flavobacteriales bacterium]|nr:alpha/beta hydrolase [Flavobacteriales bacterium]